MRTKIAAFAGIVCVAVACYVGVAVGQNKAASAPTVSSKVALIDMAEVFKQYKKFKVLREDLADKIKAKDEEIKVVVKKAQGIQQKLQGTDLVKGSPEYNELEKQFIQLSGEIESARRQAQAELTRDEAKNYHTIYLEVQAAVKKFAETFDYTMVMRFSREELDSTDPQKVVAGLGRTVVYFKADDDITDGVIEFINRPYKNTAQRPGAVTPTNAERPATTPKARPATSTGNK